MASLASWQKLESITPSEWLLVLVLTGSLLFTANAIYNLYFHPLAHIPGPFWARASGIPSWWHARSGKRHVWLWRQFQIYGNKIRVTPNTVLFCDTQAYADIYSNKSNVRRSPFYSAWKRDSRENHTLNTIDVAEHAQKRKRLNMAFTEKTTRAAASFITDHVDRWNELLVPEERGKTGDWTTPVDLSEKLDALVFDTMGDLCFGRSFDVKEPGYNPLKAVPHSIVEYMKFYYPICRSPVLSLLLWLKPRGLNRIFAFLSPPAARLYLKFVDDSTASRITLMEKQASMQEEDRRKDLFYFLASARDPDTGASVYQEFELRAEASLLIVAGSDTTSISLSGIFFYLTTNPQCLAKLTAEVRSAFSSAEDIVYGPRLLGCEYLKACVDEGMRLVPAGPCELPREVLKGGLLVKGEYYPPGTVVGTVPWALSRSRAVWGDDAETFRPERWIVANEEKEAEQQHGSTKESVKRAREAHHPFLSGPGSCVGKNVAMVEMLIVIARTVYRFDIRRAPGSTVGGGSPGQGYGPDDPAEDPSQFQLYDAYISLRKGPVVQFRTRRV